MVEQAQPGGREPAPGRLDLVQAFVNTRDIEGRGERLGSPELAQAWLVEHGLLPPQERVTETAFVRLLELREAFRALALANNGFPLDSTALTVLNDAAAATLAVGFTEDGVNLRPLGSGVERAAAELLAIVADAIGEGSWVRMKACRRDVCRWLFYDHSRNLSSSWCSMLVCGNRTKTRAYRKRRRGGDG